MSAVVNGLEATAGRPRHSPTTMCEAASRRAFFGVLALVFVVSAIATVVGSAAMADVDGMPMPGGWTMSMAWMRMPGQPWVAAAASFLGMWVVMMVAMMLPSLTPTLWRYRRSIRRAHRLRADRLAACVAFGYFSTWAAFGLVAYPLGIAIAALAMEWPPLARAVPIAGAMAVVGAGALQLTAWKLRHLACCRLAPAAHGPSLANWTTALRHGVRLGLDCGCCCASLMAILLVTGVMDLRAMAVVTAAITLERVVPDGERVARAVGVATVAAGLILVARAVGSS